jgi:predicted ArsR family transcriptional regulator
MYKGDGDFARLLLEEVSATQGPEALQAVLRRVGDRLTARYRDKVTGGKLSDRVRAWAKVLDERGILVQVEKDGQGYSLREFGCPFQNTVQDNRSLCEMERQVMAGLLESQVKLTHCVLDGEHGCRFLISGQASNRAGAGDSTKGAQR